MTKVVGLDLSLTSTGVTVVEADAAGATVAIHRIQPPPAAKGTRHERLAYLYGHLRPLVRGADHITVEGPSFQSHNQHTMGGIWWVCMHVLWLDNPDAVVVVVSPYNLKKYATGKAGADKVEVAAAVISRWSFAVTCDDESDSGVLAVMTCDQLGLGTFAPVPQAHRAALRDWPYADGKKKSAKKQ